MFWLKSSFAYASIKYSTHLIILIIRSVNAYIPKSVMVVVDPFKFLSPYLMTPSDNINVSFLNLLFTSIYVIYMSYTCLCYSEILLCIIFENIWLNIIFIDVLYLNLYYYFHKEVISMFCTPWYTMVGSYAKYLESKYILWKL